MRVLVTGAAGFVGANLAGHLAAAGHCVHAAVRPTSDRWRLTGIEGIVCRGVDLAAPGAAEALIARVAPEWVFHLAAHGAYSWQEDARAICVANVQATVELADAAERYGTRAFVHAGSSSEYGFTDHPAGEHERLDPNSLYAVTKVAATAYCRHRALHGGLPAVTLRLYSVYGQLEDSRRLIATLLAEGQNGRLPKLVAPEIARDFVYVEDVCRAFVLAATRAQRLRGAIYNVGSGRQTTIRELVEEVKLVLGLEVEPAWGTHPPRRWDSDCWCASVERTTAELGWSSQTSLAAGLRETLRRSRASSPLTA